MNRNSSSDPLAKLFTRTRHDFGRFDYEDSYYWRTASSDGSRRDPARVVKFSPPGSSRDLLVFSEVSALDELPCPLQLIEMFSISGRRSDSYCGCQDLRRTISRGTAHRQPRRKNPQRPSFVLFSNKAHGSRWRSRRHCRHRL